MKDQGNTATLPTPFPYFGGKGLIAPKVWTRFGEVRRYIEPFCGSARVLFARPGDVEGIEIINDANGWLTNFWRAAKLHPRALARVLDYPVSELDLHARGDWLFYRRGAAEWIEWLRGGPDRCDVRAAAWWCWGQCSWIGCGWGQSNGNAAGTAMRRIKPNLRSLSGVHRKIPSVAGSGRRWARDIPGGAASPAFL